MLRTITFLTIWMAAPSAWAWSETGHDIVGRVAVRLLEDKNVPDLAQMMAVKEHQIGHLSNVPDIHWKNIGKHIDVMNNSTHYVDAEFVLPAGAKTAQNLLPKDITAYVNAIQANCDKEAAAPKGKAANKKVGAVTACPKGKTMSEKLNNTGTAPLRIDQFVTAMRDAMTRAKKAKTRSEMVDAVNEALLYGGLVSHFFGDLAQPLHVSKNYDGWDNGAGGLHAYFEGDIVDAQGLALPDRVYQRAKSKKPASALWEKLPKKTRKQFIPGDLAWELTLDSLQQVDRLYEMDQKYSLIKPSIAGGKRRKQAERKKPIEVAPAYADLVEERLALAADTLSDAWIMAWKAAGSPSFKDYQSWNYHLAPNFIPPTYLGTFLPEAKGL